MHNELDTHLIQLLLSTVRARDDGIAAALEVVEGFLLRWR